MTKRRVVVTGIGPVTPVGTGIEEFWTGLTTGRNGIRRIQRFDPSDLPVTVAGEVADFEPDRWMDKKEARRTDRFTHFSIASAKLAWEDAGDPEVGAERGGVVFATGIGGIETLLQQHSVLLEKGPGRVSPFMVPALMANAPAGITRRQVCASRQAMIGCVSCAPNITAEAQPSSGHMM